MKSIIGNKRFGKNRVGYAHHRRWQIECYLLDSLSFRKVYLLENLDDVLCLGPFNHSYQSSFSALSRPPCWSEKYKPRHCLDRYHQYLDSHLCYLQTIASLEHVPTDPSYGNHWNTPCTVWIAACHLRHSAHRYLRCSLQWTQFYSFKKETNSGDSLLPSAVKSSYE